jgi:hypothetical protein
MEHSRKTDTIVITTAIVVGVAFVILKTIAIVNLFIIK